MQRGARRIANKGNEDVLAIVPSALLLSIFVVYLRHCE
jgi:hypothetical protein